MIKYFALRPFRRLFSGFFTQQSGNVAMIFAIAIIPIFAAVGSAVDYSRLSNQFSYIQEAADSAVLAAAIEYDKNNSDRIEIGKNIFSSHTRNPCDGDIAISIVGDEVTGTTSCELDTTFLGIIGITEIAFNNTAIAIVDPLPPCLLALNPTSSQDLAFNGGVTLNGPKCKVHVNSKHGFSAMTGSKNAKISVANICVVGGFKGNNFQPTPQTGCEPEPDPYSYMPQPVVGACDHNNLSIKSDTTLFPGVFCGGIKVGSTKVKLNPGIYYIKDGPLSLSSQTVVTGDEVTFVFTGSAYVEISGGAQVILSASPTGPYRGMLFYQHANEPAGYVSKIAGGAKIQLEGVIYLANQKIKITGSATTTTAFNNLAGIVADTIEINGQGEVLLSASAQNLALEHSRVRLLK